MKHPPGFGRPAPPQRPASTSSDGLRDSTRHPWPATCAPLGPAPLTRTSFSGQGNRVARDAAPRAPRAPAAPAGQVALSRGLLKNQVTSTLATTAETTTAFVTFTVAVLKTARFPDSTGEKDRGNGGADSVLK